MATVLIVDGVGGRRARLAAALAAEGHAVEAVPSALAGPERLAGDAVNVVLLALSLPGGAAWRFLAALKGPLPSPGSDVPVLVLGDDDAEQRIRSGIEGAVEYLGPPHRDGDVVVAVQRTLEGGPELEQRRAAQRRALAELAHQEGGGGPREEAVVPRLTRFEHRNRTPGPLPALMTARERLGTLTDAQRALVEELAARSASEAAVHLGVSRSNVYASLRRIVRKLEVGSVDHLRTLIRDHGLLGEP
ncbi:MAG TPA: hypothetical protein VMN58_12585 [Acidimicrobiales bacterium]|nr:hypothetical protein [Acidimicrobiales bacterium]